MMRCEAVNEWGTIFQSTADGTIPSTTSFGTSITPGVNTYGTYATLISGAALTRDVYMIDIFVGGVFATATARTALAALGLDPAGGTTFTKVADLLVGNAGSVQSRGMVFRFPLFIKAGTSIGMAGSYSTATVPAFSAKVICYADPSNVENVNVGTYIEQLGVVTATSTGTAITPGSASEGAWTDLGSPTKPCFWWDYGWACLNNTISLANCDVDLGIGDATNKKIAIANAYMLVNTNEDVYKHQAGNWGKATTSDHIYVRMQQSVTPVAAHVVAAYGVG